MSKADELLQRLIYQAEMFAITYKSSSSNYNFDVISKEYIGLVRETILSVLNGNHDNKIGELKAKVYAYEKIISNSNFAPMILDTKPKFHPFEYLLDFVVDEEVAEKLEEVTNVSKETWLNLQRSYENENK